MTSEFMLLQGARFHKCLATTCTSEPEPDQWFEGLQVNLHRRALRNGHATYFAGNEPVAYALGVFVERIVVVTHGVPKC